MKKKIKNIILFLILLLCSIMLVGSTYYHKIYPTQEFEQILYYIANGAESTAPDVVNGVIISCALPTILLLLFLLVLTIKNIKKEIILKLKSKKIQLYPIKLIANHKFFYAVALLILSTIYTIFVFKIPQYIFNKSQNTKLFDEYYVDGKTVNITFPEEKRNLILIVMESMENTLVTKENGGSWNYSLIPELEDLSKNNINFSNTEKIGGGLNTYGSTYTAGGLVSVTAGIPLITPSLLLGDKNDYKGNGKYLANAYTLGDILKENGYNLEIIMGSDGNFGGRTQYFTANGNYKIFDLNYAIENNYMKEEDKVWWGFDDDTLYKWSKQEITNLANKNEPFNYIILTADTHFVDGYLSKNATESFDSQYENVYAYSSKSVNEFVNWIKKQDFYKNTTIVIIGDHLGMQTEFYTDQMDNKSERTIYNTIINSAIPASNTKNRSFTTLDMFPTILASVGTNIDGNKLGLGTNLFSNEKTLTEQFSFDYINNELKKNSPYYNQKILGEDYYIIKNFEKAKK